LSFASSIFSHQLVARERNFPATFAHVCEKPYGKLFYDADNPYSYDSNHGILLKLDTDLETALDDLIMFYRLRNLVPRIYPSYQEREKEILSPVLKQRGFETKTLDAQIYIRTNPSVISTKTRLQVKRIKAMDAQIREIIRTDDGGDWNLKIMECLLRLDSYHLLVGYDKGEPVCLATLTFMDNLSRLDDVVTELGNRAKGYGRALIKAVLDYHDQVAPGNHLYLWSSSPTAIKIYREAGFEVFDKLEPWEAWLDF